MVHSSDFFFKNGLTYRDCYTDLEPGACPSLPAASLNVRVDNGTLSANEAPVPPARSYAIVVPGLMDGGYRLDVGTSETPEYVYCTGRGTVTDTASCRMNDCDETTSSFVTVGPAEVGHDCYHTCFKSAFNPYY